MTASTFSSDARAQAPATLVASPHLFVVMHCAAPFEPPSRHALDGVDVVQIGRGERATVRRTEHDKSVLALTIDDRFASSAHARVGRRDGGWFLEDVGSKNGCFVNGVRVDSAPLEDGDCLQIGHTLLVLRTALATPPDAVRDAEANVLAPAFATLVPKLARDFEVLAKVAQSSTPILFTSETGSGKELLARHVHGLSGRGPFIPVNCGGLPRTSFESVLFGHKRGAFSGAVADHLGLFSAADGGTLLLDEVGDMPAEVQSAVLRALQDGEVLAVGSTSVTHVDARVLATTHWDLEQRVVEGSFRDDLLARLAGHTFRMPPLRERREDIGLLTGMLLHRIASGRKTTPALSPDAALALIRHDWPRNVRELEQCLIHASTLAGEAKIEIEHLPEGLGPHGTQSSNAAALHAESLETRLVRLLGECKGNVTLVAAAMRTSRSQVHRWMKRMDIEPGAYRRRIGS